MKGFYEERSWEEFRNAGMLWLINCLLHVFGWCIVIDYTKDKMRAFPARTIYRGFDNQGNIEGYQQVSKWMKDNAKELYNEATKHE